MAQVLSSLIIVCWFGCQLLGIRLPLTGAEIPKIGKRGFRSQKSPISHHPKKRVFRVKKSPFLYRALQGRWRFFDSEHPFLGWWEMGDFWLRNPLFPILGISAPVISGLQKGPAERGHVKKRQKSSKSVRKFFDTFRQFSRRAKNVKNRQKLSKSFSTLFDNFRAAPFFRPLLQSADVRGKRIPKSIAKNRFTLTCLGFYGCLSAGPNFSSVQRFASCNLRPFVGDRREFKGQHD